MHVITRKAAMNSLDSRHYFDLTMPLVASLFAKVDAVWDILPQIPGLVDGLTGSKRIIKGEIAPEAIIDDGPLFIGEGAVIEPGVYIQTPAYIGQGAILRQGAYLRSNVIMLAESLLGHVSEAKNAIFLPRARAPHFAYVGDSVLGHAVNLGAGVKLSNLPILAVGEVNLSIDDEVIHTGLRKFGAILGDGVQIGCNTVLNPGTVMGPGSIIYPNATVDKGIYPAATMIKVRQTHVIAEVIQPE